MAVTNMYPNLPGHLVEFKDGGLQLTTMPEDNEGYAKSLLILGTAVDGPINEPVKIDSKTVTQLFGSEVNEKGYPNGATLTKYAKQAFAHGFRDVRCMRVTGTEATAKVSVTSDDGVVIKSHTFPSNGSSVNIGGHPAFIVQLADNALPVTPDEDKNSIQFSYQPPTGETLNDTVTISRKTYAPDVGKIIVQDPDQVDKNAVLYVTYYRQKIFDKDGNNANKDTPTTKFKTSVVKDGNPIDTATTPIASDSYGPDVDVTFDLVCGNDEKLYSHPYDANDGEPYDGQPYPRMYQAIIDSVGTGNISEDDAKVLAKDLKLIVVAKYNYDQTNSAGNANENVEKVTVLPGSDFEITETTASDGVTKVKTVTIKKQTISVTHQKYNESTSSDEEVTEDIPYTHYAVKYLTYTNEFVCKTEDLSTNAVKADDDVIVIVDGGKALSNSIKVLANTVAMASDKYTVGTDASGNTKITIPAGNLKKGTAVTVSYDTEEPTAVSNFVTFKSIYGGEVYNGSKVKFEKCRDTLSDGSQGPEYVKVIFHKPEVKKFFSTELPFYYKSTDIQTVGQLRDYLKNCELNNVFTIETEDDDITLEELYDAVCRQVTSQPGSSVVSTELTLENGSNGLNPSDTDMFTALSGERNPSGYLTKMGAYQVLENYHCDYIYPAGVYADKTVNINGREQSFHYELALLCAVLTYRTKMTHGFIDVRPNTNTSLVGIQKYVDRLTSLPNLFYMQDQDGTEILDSENKRMDIGWYTSVVVGPDPVMLSDTIGTYYGSPAIAYAALVASLPPQSSPLNKALPNTKGMKYKLSNKQMDALVGNRMVCFRLKNEGSTTATSTPYCVDAMTAGGPQCDYRRMTTVNIVTDVVDQIREVADPFIGEPNTIEQRNALSALIDKRLNILYENGEVSYYSFEINATIQQVLLGECTIALTLVCPMELRKITTVVSLRAAA